MSGRRLLTLAVAVLAVGLYGARAVEGWLAGPRFSKGRHLAVGGYYERALPLLERGTAGFRRAEVLWLRGQVRVGIWQNSLRDGADAVEVADILAEAHREYTEAITLSPASGWYWASLGELYHEQEKLERGTSGLDLGLIGADPLAWIGRPGRIAVGTTRLGITREPTVYTFHDQLAMMLLDYGQREAALEAVRDSARVQPSFRFHPYQTLRPLPPDILDAFTEAARDALGSTPFLRRNLHLLALGRLEWRRGRFEQAERDLREALEAPGERLNRAEGNYFLGLVLAEQGRGEEAIEALGRAEGHPNFESHALAARARIAEGSGRLEEALALLRQARRIDSRNLTHILDFARVARRAGEWKMSEQALTWGVSLNPENPQLWRSLVATYVGLERPAEAERALAELERLLGPGEEVRRLERTIRGE